MRMRPIWTGAISFGLINIPVKLYSGSKERALQFHLLDRRTQSPIHYQKVRASDNKKVAQEDIVKAYELEKGRFVILDDEDFKHANARKTSTIDIVQFADADSIDAKYFDKPYLLEPDKKSAKAYTLLRDALEKTGKVGVATFVMKDREHICFVGVDGKALRLIQLRFNDELRPSKDITVPDASYRSQEQKLAISLIKQLSGDFDAADFKDTYTRDLLKVIRKKAKGKAIAVTEEAPLKETNMEDLFATLKKSLEVT